EKDNLKQRAYAGRLSFTDAALVKEQKDLWLPGKTITPKILSGPKPTTFQHYLVQIEPDSYKVGETRDGRAKYETRLRDFASPMKETAIRGHKFYWHKGPRNVDDIRETGDLKSGDAVHTQINPLRAGLGFSFQIRFDNLTQEELGALMFVLDIIANNEKMRLKLGMGKPLGMGAVKITPRLFVRNTPSRYSSLFGQDTWVSGYSKDEDAAKSSLAKFLNMMEDELGSGLTKIGRIKELLAILQWPGIKPDEDGKPTRYMEIEHKVPKDAHNKRGKVNEYRDRPVLPGTSSVFGFWSKSYKHIKKELVAKNDSVWVGTIIEKALGPNQSYGYIQPDDSIYEKIFFRHNEIKGSKQIKLGLKVSYLKSKAINNREEAIQINIIED
ncbi:MAG TPA: TIGR03986 family CRISPR-associated RAMP protein, partial [Anaerolineales bacterium]|nr:TIGR03986 family CRISPR-associated RAMP protein [Anaerolineales bacterium]